MKKITGYVKLQLPAGKANPSPPVGPALGQHGVNIMAFCKDFNSRMGDRSTYQQYFRQAFATGYRDGYNGY